MHISDPMKIECDSRFDIIGDVHGCSNTLARLLEKMEYQKQDGVFFHPTRRAIFLGDIVDRGPHIRESLQIIRAMVERGSAFCIMGNHEYNALAYTTRINKDEEGVEPQYMLAHTPKNNRLIAETLTQFASYPEEWRNYLSWFKTLPLYLEFAGFRVVHACWDPSIISKLRENKLGPVMSDAFFLSSIEEGTLANRTVDRLLRGTKLILPEGREVKSKDGSSRRYFRTKFWSKEPKIYQDVVFQPDPLPEDLVHTPLNADEHDKILHYGQQEKPLFIGHYWLHGRPKTQRKNVACLDYSAVKYGRLVAYRFDGEKELDQKKFEWIYVDPSIQ